MPNLPKELLEMRLRIQQADSSTELVEVSQALLLWLSSDNQETAEEAQDLIVDTFEALKTLTAHDAGLGEHLIVEQVLPLLNDNKTLRSYAASVLRGYLVAWYEQYTEHERVQIRERILRHLLQQFNDHPTHEQCLTFARIGYPLEEVLNTLFTYVEQHPSHDITESVLMALATLGSSPEKQQNLLHLVHTHLQKQVSQPLLIALDRLADATSIPILVQACLHAPVSLRSFALHVLVTIAEATHPEPKLDETTQVIHTIPDDVWQQLVTLYEQDPDTFAFGLIMGKDIAPRCDSQAVIPTMLQWLEQCAQTQGLIPQISFRLAECVRPHQLQGWDTARHHPQGIPALSVLMNQACQNSGNEGRYTTMEMRTKEAAWGTLLRLGVEDILQWFEVAVGQETNGYFRGRLATLLACFCLDPLPPTALAWVTQPYDAQPTHPSSAELIARMGAMEIVRSSATRQAFEVLRQPGLTLHGQTLLASLEAFLDVAYFLARAGDTEIADILLTSCEQPTHNNELIFSARALEILGQHSLLTSTHIASIIQILPMVYDPQAQGHLIAAIGASDLPLPSVFSAQLLVWARERNDWVGQQAFAVLASRRLLLQHEDLLQRLGLQRQGNVWQCNNVQQWERWQALVLGMLYHPQETTLLPALVHALLELSWRTVHTLIGQISSEHQDPEQSPLPLPLIGALLTRIQQSQSAMNADLELFERVGELIPEQVALTHWDQWWEDWMPQARATLADTLGSLPPLPPEATTNVRRLLLLLAHDGQYVVRRAAYRAGARQYQATLLHACQTWANSHLRDLRILAAEACVWLEGQLEAGYAVMTASGERLTFPLPAYPTLEQLLRNDPEPTVRETYARVRTERQKRQWAQAYLRLILDGHPWANQDIFRLWSYAEALKHIGDDTTIHDLHQAISTIHLPPHVQQWFRQILKDTSEGWKKASKKWPQPTNSRHAFLEETDALLLLPNGTQASGHTLLWQSRRTPDTSVLSWGGTLRITIHELQNILVTLLEEEEARLRLPNGHETTITLQGFQQARSSANASSEISFLGKGPYP